MIETCPIDVGFGPKQNVAGLKIITGLNAADELGDAAIEVVAGNVQAAICPASAKIRADIKSGPVVGRRRGWGFVDRSFRGQI